MNSKIYITDDNVKKVKYMNKEELEETKKCNKVVYLGWDKASWVDVFVVTEGSLGRGCLIGVSNYEES